MVDVSMIKRFNLLSVLVLLLGGGWIWFSTALSGETTQGQIPAPQKGFLAPEFSLPTLEGQTYSLAEQRGGPVLINVWASWCPPCRAEMPAMQRVYDDYASQGFTILAVNTTYQDDLNAAVAFIEELELTFPILLDLDGQVSRQYLIRAMPTSFFVDSQGIIQDVVLGGPLSEALLRVRIEQLLEANP
jgi:cytochrome c biogenesis protein CcmG, thiol:disulfide interchange protein DsbE